LADTLTRDAKRQATTNGKGGLAQLIINHQEAVEFLT